MTKTLIVIPARYGSSRFPGKPLAQIADRAMVELVAEIAQAAADTIPDCNYVVATDDQRIADHCEQKNIPSVMTDLSLASGSDRALSAAELTAPDCQFVINLQGDAPFTPVEHITAVADALANGSADAATPCIQLSWDALDQMRLDKRTTPHSGTTCVFDAYGRALWFSKQIIPALRDETALRGANNMSPIYRHVGLYGFKREALKKFTALSQSPFEKLEGLEQLRMLENGMRIDVVCVDPPAISTSGIDTKEDLERLERLIKENRN